MSLSTFLQGLTIDFSTGLIVAVYQEYHIKTG
jgi:hypothetical protein